MIKDSPDLINARDSNTENDTRLHTAARLGQSTVVQFLLANGAEVDARNKSGRTPLHEASVMGRLAVVQLLLDRKAELNATDRNGSTPAHLAAGEGYKSVLEALLAAGADPNAKDSSGATPLHRAASKDRKAVAELLLAKGARKNEPDSNGQTALHLAAATGNISAMSALLDAGSDVEAKDFNGATPLIYSVNAGRLPTLRLLLARKADANVSFEISGNNAKQRTWPILQAVLNLPLMELLLTNGANPNVRIQWSVENEENGTTPLIVATRSPESRPAVQLLLRFKADPNLATEAGKTPLHLSLGQTGSLQDLLDAGANVNAATTSGETPLHWAVGAGLKPVVSTLLAHQAAVDARDNRGMTPLHWASVLGNREIAELLLLGKADPNARDGKDRTPLELARLQNNFSRTHYVESAGLTVARFSEGPSFGMPGIVPMRPPGQINLPGQAVTASGSYLSDSQKAFAETLTSHGAIEDFPRLDRIEVRRPSVNYRAQLFKRGTNDWNRFTLLELLGTHYYLLASEPRGEPGGRYSGSFQDWRTPALEFPDLSRVRIRRAGANPGSWQEQTIDLSPALESGDCTKDVTLQWGDVIDIPVADHVLNEAWKGFSSPTLLAVKKCLTREIDIVVKGKSNRLTLSPEIIINSLTGMTELATRIPFWIKPVLLNSKLLLASSDLSRIKVTRLDPGSGQKREFLVDCSEPKPAPDFWLRNGDVIEVPDRSGNP